MKGFLDLPATSRSEEIHVRGDGAFDVPVASGLFHSSLVF